eukprot:364502-Chlamydomonas_euryale.AAC.6
MFEARETGRVEDLHGLGTLPTPIHHAERIVCVFVAQLLWQVPTGRAAFSQLKRTHARCPGLKLPYCRLLPNPETCESALL